MEDEEIIKDQYAEATRGIKDEWFTNCSDDFYHYILALPKHLQYTYLIVVLHHQVLNGGFHQYFSNKYGELVNETIGALNSIGAFGKSNLLQAAFFAINSENQDIIKFRESLINGKMEHIFTDHNIADRLQIIDDEYDTSNKEDIVYLLAAFLRDYLKK